MMGKKSIIDKFHNHDELTIEERRIINVGDIKRNRAQCLKCGKIIESKHRHDFQECGCDNQLSVDGGTWYLKRSAKDIKSCLELSEWYKDIPK